MMVQSHERKRLSDVVTSRIRDFIIQNELECGDRLPTELELAKQFGVSRVSIREATKSLCFLGFLDATPRRGTTVGKVNLRRVTQFLELHPSVRDASAQNLVDAREIVEVGTLPILLKRMQGNPAIYSRLNELVARFSTVDDVEEWIELDRQFHSQLIEESGVSPLVPLHELLFVFFDRIYAHYQKTGSVADLKAQFPAGAASHQRIIDFLRDGLLDQADSELRNHIRSQAAHLDVPRVDRRSAAVHNGTAP